MMNQIEDIYTLSPMQQGMLFHYIMDPSSGVYLEQMRCNLEGDLNVDAFQKAWQQVVNRHPVFRTAFVWEDVDEPVQVVYRQIDIQIEQKDWRDLPSKEQQKRLEEFLQEDLRKGLDLTDAPLMRLFLIRLEDRKYHFVWTHHHLLLDGWTLPLVLREVFTFYEAYSRGQEVYLEPSPPYRDYIAWLQQQDVSKAEAFWRQNLKGFIRPTPLPYDVPPGAKKITEKKYAKEVHFLPQELSARLDAFARENKITLSTIFQAAWGFLLHTYSGEDDVVFGATFSGRPADLPGADSIVGLFINTLPIRQVFDPNRSVLEHLKQLQLQQAEIRQYEYSHLIQIQGWSDVPRGVPLFESILVFENYPVDSTLKEQGGSLQIRDVTMVERTNYPITFVVSPGKKMNMHISYDANAFKTATIRRMLRHLENLLRQMVQQPHQSWVNLNVLDEAEKQRLLVEWNNTALDYPRESLVPRLFEEQVERTPEAVAVVYRDQQITYRELNKRANRIANYLRAQGVGPEVLVGIFLDRSPDMVASILGVLKAGGAYLPLDPSNPKERLAFILEDAGAQILLTHSHLLKLLPDTNLPAVCLDSDWNTIAPFSAQNPGVALSPGNLAYVIYTSGSTGRPKGTLIHHQGLLNYLMWCKHAYPLEAGQGAPVYSSISFDLTITGLFSPLLVGRRIELIPEEYGIETLSKALQSGTHFSLIKITPAHLELLNQQLANRPFSGRTSAFVIGGENLLAETIAFWQQKAPDTMLINEYGPTETVVGSCVYQIPGDEPLSGSVPIGRPIINTQLYILNSHLQPVPVGVSGELFISGEGVARGYLRRPDLTAEKFLPNPFSGKPGDRMYRTGDLARFREDGIIEFLGRIDNQVKIRGFRIELGEIEAVLSEHPAVREAVVLAREDAPGDRRLVAYLVPKNESLPGVTELRQFLEEKLPSYQIPSAFVVLDEFPLTPNGKVDRRALPAPEQSRSDLLGQYVAPRTPVEELLATIWSDVLGVDRVGVTDNFFELGGHSLLATQLISRIRDAFQVEIPLNSLFEVQNLGEMASLIETTRQREDGLEMPPLKPIERSGELPLSFSQQRLWFIDQLAPGSPFYNIPIALRLIGDLKVEVLEKSLNEIVRRHEVLRTSFSSRGGKPVLHIEPELQVTIPISDLTDLPETEREEKVQQLAEEEFRQPFDLQKAPLFRARLLKLTDQEHVVLFTMHHIISDGWSINILVEEVASLYQAFVQGKPSPLPELPVQYVDFAAWQREWLKDEILERQLAYWKKQLAGFPPLLELPTDHPRPAVQSFRGGRESVRIPAEIRAGIEKISRQAGATTFMALLAAFQTLLYRYSRQEDILVGSPIAGRRHSEVERLIGFFVNNLVFRTFFSREKSFKEILQQVREAAIGAYEHQDLPFEKLVEELHPVRDLSHHPIFQVMFVMQNIPSQSLELPGLTIRGVNFRNEMANYDLTLQVQEGAEGYLAEMEYNADLFEAETIRRMLRHFINLLKGIIREPDLPVSRIPMLEEEERYRLLVEWTDKKMDFPWMCAHQLFEKVVEKYPDKIALSYTKSFSPEEPLQTMSYAELNRRANQLARYLQKNGIRPEKLVGILMERSLEMVVAILGVLKAGAAYVPIDPAYPRERALYMLKDSGASLLLTQQSLAKQYGFDFLPVVSLDAEWETICTEDDHNLNLDLSPENLAYIIYTSGSTGRPKGTLLTHRGIPNFITVQSQFLGIDENTKVLQFASLSFDSAVWEIMMALLHGGTLYLLNRELVLNTDALVRFLREQEISVVTLPPSVLTIMEEKDLPRLETVISAGESCTREIVTRWKTGRTFVNGYGPTEGTVCTTLYKVEDDPVPVNVPIGSSIGNVRVYVLDDNLNPQPVGVPGELHIEGVNLARGYLGRPDLTAEKFIPNPFSEEAGSRLYKTGDLVRYLPDGRIEFLGRIDLQVKIRGFRVELGEIESVINEYPGVLDVVVLAREDRPREKRLVAYLVIDKETGFKVGDLRTYLQEQLPDYMVPSYFVVLDAFPLTPNGKVDKRALPAPDQTRPELESEYVAPRNETEEKLVAICAELLNVEKVGVYDNFFDLGGHSLLATQFVSRLKESFQVELPLRALFEKPLIAELAIEIDRLKKSGQTTQVPSISRASRDRRRVKLSDLKQDDQAKKGKK